MSAATPVERPYLQGNYAPIHSEIAADTLEVIGELPRDLAGVFVRNSSNPRFLPEGRYHWFDGDGMLHGVRISRGRASYRKNDPAIYELLLRFQPAALQHAHRLTREHAVAPHGDTPPAAANPCTQVHRLVEALNAEIR